MNKVTKRKNKRFPKFPFNLKEKDANIINNFLFMIYDVYGKKRFTKELDMMIEFVSLGIKEEERDSKEYVNCLNFFFLLKSIINRNEPFLVY